MKIQKARTGLILLIISLLLFYLPSIVHAQSSAGDLIGAVNGLRAANGLPPFEVDGNLMAYAQQHSEYQASIGETTHTHADGSSPADASVFENVAQGEGISADTIVNSIWSDAAHRSTMINIKAGYIGAGVASANGVTYYTIDVRKNEGFSYTLKPTSTPAPGQKPGTQQPAVDTPIPLVALATSTPHPDGMVVHLVGYGQTLWDIARAYGIAVADLQQLNGLSSSAAIYAGQKLLIRLPIPTLGTAAAQTATAVGFTSTPSPTITRTRRPTSTHAPTRTARPTTQSSTIPITQYGGVQTGNGASNPTLDPKTIGIVLVVICLLGLGILFWSGYRRKRS